MKISITGELGSGKSTIAKEISRILKARYIYTGSLHREIAKKYKVNSLDLNKLAFQEKSIDKEIDNYLVSLNKELENLVVDSRMAWHFIKDTIKIYLTIKPAIAAQRIMNDKIRSSEPDYENLSVAMSKIKERKQAEEERFLQKYGVNSNDLNNFDLVIDTSFGSIENIRNMILDLIEKRSEDTFYPIIWVNPQLLYPTEPIKGLGSQDAREIREKINKNGYDLDYPLECIRYDGRFFIKNGHKRCSAALRAKIEFIPVCEVKDVDAGLHEGDLEKTALASINQSLYYDWEDAHCFSFSDYPTT